MKMNFDYIQSCQYLISSHQNYTKTNLANHLEKVSPDTINPDLKKVSLSSEILWKNVQAEIVTTGVGY